MAALAGVRPTAFPSVDGSTNGTSNAAGTRNTDSAGSTGSTSRSTSASRTYRRDFKPQQLVLVGGFKIHVFDKL